MTPEENNVHAHWVATLLALGLAFFAWFAAHAAPIASGFAVLAAIFSMRASRATKKLRDDQLQNPHRYNWQEDGE